MEAQEANPQANENIALEESIKEVKQQAIGQTVIIEGEEAQVLSKCEASLGQTDQTNQQSNLFDKPLSFAELKQGNCETQTQKDQAQAINRYVGTSHEELISIAETNNCQVNEIQSSDTIFTEEQKDEHLLGKETVNLTQSTPFQILQESLPTKKQENCLSDNLFIQTHTEEIQLDQSQSAKKQQQNASQCKHEMDAKIQESLKTILSARKSKLKMEKILEVAHLPSEKKPAISENIAVQQKINIKEKIEQKTEVPVAMEVIEEKKAQPLKIDDLFISSLRSRSEIKPPQPLVAKESLKPWMKLRSKKSTNEPIIPIVNPTETKEETVISTIQNKSQQTPKVQLMEKKGILQGDVLLNKKNAQLQQDHSKEKKESTVAVAKEESQLMPHQPKEPELQFHRAAHHPLEGPINLNVQVNQQNSTQKIEEIVAPNQEQLLLLPLIQPNYQYQPLPQMKYSSSASSSQKQEIDINYNHNKKYQEQLHKKSLQKIKDLIEKLKQQEQLNRQLQKSMSLPLRLLGSVLIGASTAGITWLLRRKRTESIVLGLAFTMSTFVFSS